MNLFHVNNIRRENKDSPVHKFMLRETQSKKASSYIHNSYIDYNECL